VDVYKTRIDRLDLNITGGETAIRGEVIDAIEVWHLRRGMMAKQFSRVLSCLMNRSRNPNLGPNSLAAKKVSSRIVYVDGPDEVLA
jgi:hypothetical protein